MLIFVTILQVIVGVVLSAMILFQSGKNRGLSDSIGGIMEHFNHFFEGPSGPDNGGNTQ